MGLHVLIVPSWYKTPEQPVYGSFFEEQARALLKRENKVGILFPEFSAFSDKESSLKEFYDDDGLPTYRIRFKARIPRWRTFNYHDFRREILFFFNQYVNENGYPDMIHAHTTLFGGIAAEYIHQKTSIPFVITEHYTPFITGDITNKTDLKISERIFKKAGQANVVSSTFKKDLSAKLHLPADLFHVIHNMVNPIFFEDNSIRKMIKGQPIRLFTNSYLLPRKNHKLMLDAFRIFLKSYPESEFVIGGNGPLKNELVSQATALGIADKVRFAGLLNRNEVRDELNKCHIFLLASTYETFGVVLIEALAVGRPVVTTDSGGPRDIVTEKNGYIVTSWKPEDYAEKLLQLVDQYSSYNQNEISADCRQRFGEDKIITEIQESYYRVLNQ